MCRILCVSILRDTVEALYEAYCEAHCVDIQCIGILKKNRFLTNKS